MYQPQEGLLVHYDVPVHSRGGGSGSGVCVCVACCARVLLIYREPPGELVTSGKHLGGLPDVASASSYLLL